MRKIQIDGEVYVLKGDIYVLFKELPSSRQKSWITFQQISLEYPEFLDKIAEVLFSGDYDERSKEFVRSLLFFLDVDGFLSWKQFDSVFRICTTYKEYLRKKKNGTFFSQAGRII